MDKGKVYSVLLTDLSKAFNCLSHEMIISKLNAYGFSLHALKLKHNCFAEWKQRSQRTKINQAYSSWEEIPFGLPQGSMLRSILFNIFLIDLVLVVHKIDFASYALHNSILPAVRNINDVTLLLQESSRSFLRWFADNQLKISGSKCYLIVTTDNVAKIQIEDSEIKNSNHEKLLGVRFDNKHDFPGYVKGLLQKSKQQLKWSC